MVGEGDGLILPEMERLSALPGILQDPLGSFPLVGVPS